MSASVNKVILIGHLGRDPEIRFSQAGKKIANFSIATSDHWNDRQTGERRERTEWHRIVVFNEGLADICERYLKKGSKVYLEGALRTRKWQGQDGKDNYTTEVVLEAFNASLTMLDTRRDGPPSADDPAGYGNASTSQNRPVTDPDLDDEIPF
jgi:single-strand DNA-binding protein